MWVQCAVLRDWARGYTGDPQRDTLGAGALYPSDHARHPGRWRS